MYHSYSDPKLHQGRSQSFLWVCQELPESHRHGDGSPSGLPS